MGISLTNEGHVYKKRKKIIKDDGFRPLTGIDHDQRASLNVF